MSEQSSNQKLTRRSRLPADHIGVLLAALVMIMLGWLGLAALVMNRPPRIGAELWLFFVLLQIAITGTSIPLVRYLNNLFTAASRQTAPGGVIVRQSVWIGLFIVVCSWLQIQRGLSLPIAFFLALVFIVLEVFLRSRELGDDEDYDE